MIGSLKRLVHQLQQAFSRNHGYFWLMVKVRNQANIAIGLHMSSGTNIEQDGERLLVSMVAPDSKNFVDVGANVGQWVAEFSSRMKAGTGVCIEPVEASARVLEATIEATSRVPVKILKCALSDVAGEAQFWEHELSVLSGLIETTDSGVSKSRKVITRRLEDVLDGQGWQEVDFVKIDTEGWDFKVIRGAGRYIDEARIRVLQFEYGGNWRFVGDTLGAAVRFLKARGYEIFVLRGDGLHRFDADFVGDYFMFSNFVAIRAADVSRYANLVQA
jgi:FkbM family methyltransferase